MNLQPSHVSFFDLRNHIGKAYKAESLSIESFKSAPIVLESAQHLRAAYTAAPNHGYALEFGVFKGKSIRNLALANKSDRFVGFDSFEGLPEPWVRSHESTYEKGHFAVPRLPAVPPNVELVKGFFDQSVVPWLQENTGDVAFVHIDCDLYGGAKYVLDAVSERLLDGAVIVFDELADWYESGVYPNWRDGEWLALNDWLAESGLAVRVLLRGETYQAAVQVCRSKQVFGNPDLLGLLNAVWQSGAKAQAIDLLETVFKDSEPWLPAAHRFVELSCVSEPAKAKAYLAQIWEQAQTTPEDDDVVDLLHLRARSNFKLNLVDEADRDMRLYLRKRSNHPRAVSFAGSVARAKKDYERAATLFRRWNVLSGNPKATEAAEDCARLATIRPDFRGMKFSGLMIQHIIDSKEFETVLDHRHAVQVSRQRRCEHTAKK